MPENLSADSGLQKRLEMRHRGLKEVHRGLRKRAREAVLIPSLTLVSSYPYRMGVSPKTAHFLSRLERKCGVFVLCVLCTGKIHEGMSLRSGIRLRFPLFFSLDGIPQAMSVLFQSEHCCSATVSHETSGQLSATADYIQ